MANSTIPILLGFDYQARWFWMQACRLFAHRENVARVGYEVDDIKGFDDVAVYYGSSIPDTVTGARVSADYYQIKFHMTRAGAFSCQSLTEPAFINAQTHSLLMKLHVASKLAPTADGGCRFYIVSPRPILHGDPLADLLAGTRDGEINLNALFAPRNGPGGKIGKVREMWRTHLGMSSNLDLERVLRSLRIKQHTEDLADLNARLSDRFAIAGMEPLDPNQYSRYDDLIRKVRSEGRKEFCRDDIQAMCEQNKLWRGCQVVTDDVVRLGIRSFLRWAEYMGDETDSMICLAEHFDGRKIRKPDLWNTVIAPRVSGFLKLSIRRGRTHQMHLDTHASIAFFVGYCLDSKCGAEVIPVQKTRGRSEVWKPAPCSTADAFPTWTFQSFKCGAGPEVALAVSATHDVTNDVQDYVSRALPNVGRIIICRTTPMPSSTAVQGASHALFLSQQLAAFLKSERTSAERGAAMHIFEAAPNGLAFFTGQLAHGFGRCILYEYDFGLNGLGAYEPSISLPVGGRHI